MFPPENVEAALADGDDQPDDKENQEAGQGKKKAAPKKKPKSKSKSPAPKKPHVAVPKKKVPQATDPSEKKADKQLADRALEHLPGDSRHWCSNPWLWRDFECDPL